MFLVAAIVAVLIEAGVWRINEEALWGAVLVGVALAFLIEWRVAGRQGHNSEGVTSGKVDDMARNQST